MQKRKTIDYLVIIASWGYGWDYVQAAPADDCEEVQQLKNDLKSYKANDKTGYYKTKRVRLKKDQDINEQLRLRNY